MVSRKYFLPLVLLSIIFLSGCIEEGDPCTKNGINTCQGGKDFKCIEGRWKIIGECGENSYPGSDSLESKFGQDHSGFKDWVVNDSKNTQSVTQKGACVICDNELGKECTLLAKSQCDRKLIDKNGQFLQGKNCEDSEANLDKICDSKLSFSAEIRDGKIFVNLKDITANKNPNLKDKVYFQFYYTVESYDDPCGKSSESLYKGEDVFETELNSGEWDLEEQWESNDVIVVYTDSNGTKHRATAGKYEKPTGC